MKIFIIFSIVINILNNIFFKYFIKKYFADIFQVNIDKKILERTYYKNTIRRLFSFRKEIFLSYVFKSVKKDPFLIFDIKIITLVGVKLLKSIL